MSETKQASDDSLWPNEEYAIEQYESGKDTTKLFETPEALIEDLHRAERLCGT